MPGKTKKSTCDLCCDSIDKGQECLKCEGDCGCTVHRYCAGVTKRHFEELSKGSTPFVCQWCALKTTHAVIQQLQSEVASLKLELAEARELASRASTPSPIPGSYASAASRPQQSSGHAIASKGRRAPRAVQRRTTVPSPSDAAKANLARSSNPGSATTRNADRSASRVQVEGARRVWNTYIHASTKSVDSAISRFCKIEGLKIKRKTRTNNRTGKLNWWFVVHGEEATLCDLEKKWEALQMQTSWVLEKCTKPSDSVETNLNATSEEPPIVSAENPVPGVESENQSDSEVQLATDQPATSPLPSSPARNESD